MTKEERLAVLEHEYTQLKKQLPKHGIKPSTIERLDELEEEIIALRVELGLPKLEEKGSE